MKEVHVFGRGLARLRVANCDGLACLAAGTLDGLIMERTRGKGKFTAVKICGARTRVQNSTITGTFEDGLIFCCAADPVVVSCRCVLACGSRPFFT